MTEGHCLDPADWDAFEKGGHGIATRCVDRLCQARELHWQAPPEIMDARVAITGQGGTTVALFDRVFGDIVSYATGNGYPRFRS